ncbi:MAG: glycine dehydrogenase, partial [Candidatus Omnitrophica bacterium]|nr:glycine dehydrogenase [Candidatus Omnitrophota bacterium]
YPVSLGILKSPGEMDADIVVGEGQSLGIPLSFGGPYLGFMATKREYIRNLPGRIVGLTCDREGRAGFVLTLQAREQHIRREKAKSNICTNEALCALRAVIFLSLFGKEGLRQLAGLNYRKSEFAKSELEKISHIEVRRTQPTFNEFTIKLSRDADEVAEKMAERGFLCGFPLGRFYKEMKNHLLVCVTEKRTKEEILGLVRAMKEIT